VQAPIAELHEEDTLEADNSKLEVNDRALEDFGR